jgi:hypothetical protein
MQFVILRFLGQGCFGVFSENINFGVVPVIYDKTKRVAEGERSARHDKA